MKKNLIPVILVLVLPILAACGTGRSSSEMANPWSDFKSLKEAENAAGYELGMPETLGSYKANVFRTKKEGYGIGILEVRYYDGDSEINVRKSAGEGVDISGVYGLDIRTTEQLSGGEEITYCRKDSSGTGPVLVTFRNGGYSWSIYAEKGFSGDSCSDFLSAALSTD